MGCHSAASIGFTVARSFIPFSNGCLLVRLFPNLLAIEFIGLYLFMHISIPFYPSASISPEDLSGIPLTQYYHRKVKVPAHPRSESLPNLIEKHKM